MKVLELIEEFEAYRNHSGGLPHGVVLGPDDVDAIQLELACETPTVVATNTNARRLPVSSEPGDVYTMTILGVPVFMRAGYSGIEMWRDR